MIYKYFLLEVAFPFCWWSQERIRTKFVAAKLSLLSQNHSTLAIFSLAGAQMIKSFLFWQNVNSPRSGGLVSCTLVLCCGCFKRCNTNFQRKGCNFPLKTLITRAWAVGTFLRLTLGCFLEWDKWASGSLGPRLRRPNHRAQSWEIISFPPLSASDGFSSPTRFLVPPLSLSTLIHKRVLSKSQRPEVRNHRPVEQKLRRLVDQCVVGADSSSSLPLFLILVLCPHQSEMDCAPKLTS